MNGFILFCFRFALSLPVENRTKMNIFRIFLLAAAMGLFAVNFLAIDYQDLWSGRSQWAYVRIVIALALVILLVAGLRQEMKRKKQGAGETLPRKTRGRKGKNGSRQA